MGSKLGVMKIAAKKTGLSYEEYTAKTKAGFKWCWKCKSWLQRELFNIDKSRTDGLFATCQSCHRVKVRKKRKNAAPSIYIQNKATNAVRTAIRQGRISKPSKLPCFYCGKRAAEYHHYLGYERTHWLSVRATCRRCHRKQHWE